MDSLLIVSAICFLMVLVIALLFTFKYLFRKEFMPYHSVAVERNWDQVDGKIQVLILALMRVVGGGWLASAVALSFFLYCFFFKEQEWAVWALLLTGLAVSVPTLAATLLVKTKTKANPPVRAVILVIFLLLLGWVTGVLV